MGPAGKNARRLSLALTLSIAALSGLAAQTQGLLVSAASSLTDVLQAIRPAAEKSIGASIVFNFGASGSLRAQIEQGAPVDIFFSAASADMDKLEKARLLIPNSRRDLLGNALVLVGDKTTALPADYLALKSLIGQARLLAIGNPDSVPAGRYAALTLQSLDLYRYTESRLVLGGSAREVLQYVESGSALLGIVFKTDALSVKPGSHVAILYEFSASSLDAPITYPVAVVAASKQASLASKLVDFLASQHCKDIFMKAGFLIK